MDRLTVRNRDFERFVRATGHVTVAERPADPADYPDADPALLEPSSVVFAAPTHEVDMHDHYSWWTYVPGADWRHPQGPGSSIRKRPDHPVVHLAWEDALAYADWAGKEIPTEAEWELAARGGLDGAPYAWGEELTPDGVWMANTWQGRFPYENTGADGYMGTAPVGRYPPNGYGLYDMIGNVWEWTTDWYGPHSTPASPCCAPTDRPVDQSVRRREASIDPATPRTRIPRKVIKGGSHLCAPNYCRRYRPAARMAHAVDTATCHLGLRLITRTDSH
jgi:formylglycine-generating enzyme required for sulfatase activity